MSVNQEEQTKNLTSPLLLNDSNLVEQPSEAEIKEEFTIFDGSLAITSVQIGAGILAIPQAMYEAGLSTAIGIALFVPAMHFVSTYILMRLKDMTDTKADSTYELCYMVLGRKSIFFVSLLCTFCNVGFCIIYYILFS